MGSRGWPRATLGCEEDDDDDGADVRDLNDAHLPSGHSVMSCFARPREFWIVTEGDRSMTTILMPNDY
jgi:hypothetical protein